MLTQILKRNHQIMLNWCSLVLFRLSLKNNKSKSLSLYCPLYLVKMSNNCWEGSWKIMWTVIGARNGFQRSNYYSFDFLTRCLFWIKLVRKKRQLKWIRDSRINVTLNYVSDIIESHSCIIIINVSNFTLLKLYILHFSWHKIREKKKIYIYLFHKLFK